MMTQPIRIFESFTSEPATATKFVAPKLALSFEEHRRLEMRARYARAQVVSEILVDAGLWLTAKVKAAIAGFKAGAKLRAAESHLLRMSDRELQDLGLTRSDIEYAVRQHAEGVAPAIEMPSQSAAAANQNMRHAA